MNFLIDTHALIWTIEGSSRVSNVVKAIFNDQSSELFLSAVTAWELADLRRRNRVPASATVDLAIDLLSPKLLDLPAELWRIAERLPNLHGDPTDRMLIAHALFADMTLITADRMMRRYPIKTLW